MERGNGFDPMDEFRSELTGSLSCRFFADLRVAGPTSKDQYSVRAGSERYWGNRTGLVCTLVKVRFLREGSSLYNPNPVGVRIGNPNAILEEMDP